MRICPAFVIFTLNYDAILQNFKVNYKILKQVFASKFYMLGEKIKEALKNAGITYAKAANEMGISEGSLYNIFKKDSFEISYLLKISELVGLPASYFLEEGHSTPPNIQTGGFNQSGNNLTQKIKGSKASSQESAKQLEDCQRDNEALKRELALANALVAAKDETISLLRGSYRNPN